MSNYELEKIWDDWIIEEQIGQSEDSKVYKAKRESFNRIFYSAIKVITIPKNSMQNQIEYGMSIEDTKEYYKEYVNEILKTVTLLEEIKGGKNIVNIEDCKVVELKETMQWEIYLRMDLLQNVKKYFLENKVRVIDIINLGIDICEALENCEKINIMHGNIKPENIFISKFKEFKLGDFRLAKKLGYETSTMSKNDYLFSAPEIYRNYEPNNTTDIYSLGIVMYYLLNHNRIPFMPEYNQKVTPRDVNNALLKRMEGNTIPKIKNIPDDLYNILRKMCAVKKEERYQTAIELKNDLKSIQNNYEENEENELERTVNIFSKRKEQSKAQEEVDEKPFAITKNNKINEANFKNEIDETSIQTKQTVENKEREKNFNINKNTSAQKTKSKSNSNKINKKKIIVFIVIVLVVIIGIIVAIFTKLNDKQKTNLDSEQLSQEENLKIIVPTVVDMDYETAKTLLEQIGFEVEKEEVENTEKTSGNVITQSIDSNTEVPKGTKITLQVAK